MRVVLFQMDIAWADSARNWARLDEAIARHPGADLYVLPEMFSTGFATQPQGIAEESPCATLDWMKRKAAETGAALYGSVALHEDGRYYNRGYFVKPDGEVSVYNKHHLFTHGGEHEHFTAGQSRTVVEWKGVRFLLSVCYDLRFPVWLRCKDDYDVIICVANWPTPRQMNFDILLRARAIENQCYVLGVNRVGTDGPGLDYTGGTALIHPFGQVLERCEDRTEGEIDAELDMTPLVSGRERFPVLADADPFELI